MSDRSAVPHPTNAGLAEHAAGALAHQALFYRSDEDYVDGVMQFIAPGVEAGEPIAVAVPRPRAELLRERLDALGYQIELFDMLEVGRNPARIIPAVHELLAGHGGQLLHYVGEPIWPGRSPEEIREATRHEALINLAWPGAAIRVLCPYDAEALGADVLSDAERTHPCVIRDGAGTPSPHYAATVPAASDAPLAGPPDYAATLRYEIGDLRHVRALVADRAAAATGLAHPRADDLVLAVNEVATNAIKHARGPGRIRVWTTSAELICQLEDAGHIADPLAGRYAPAPSADGGLGLWMVNQLCDLVELRSTPAGTTIRLHMARC